MNELEELIKKTDYTQEEYEIYRKIVTHFQLEDLKTALDDLLEFKQITNKEYEKATQKADLIIEKYDKWLDYDWYETMKDAIDYALEEDENE